MSIHILINEATREILPDRIEGEYAAERRADELVRQSSPLQPLALLVCKVHRRVGAEVQVTSFSELYPEPIFGESEPGLAPALPQALPAAPEPECPAAPEVAYESSLQDLR